MCRLQRRGGFGVKLPKIILPKDKKKRKMKCMRKEHLVIMFISFSFIFFTKKQGRGQRGITYEYRDIWFEETVDKY